MIEREKKRERLIQKYAEKRASLKEAFHNAENYEEKIKKK